MSHDIFAPESIYNKVVHICKGTGAAVNCSKVRKEKGGGGGGVVARVVMVK